MDTSSSTIVSAFYSSFFTLSFGQISIEAKIHCALMVSQMEIAMSFESLFQFCQFILLRLKKYYEI